MEIQPPYVGNNILTENYLTLPLIFGVFRGQHEAFGTYSRGFLHSIFRSVLSVAFSCKIYRLLSCIYSSFFYLIINFYILWKCYLNRYFFFIIPLKDLLINLKLKQQQHKNYILEFPPCFYFIFLISVH